MPEVATQLAALRTGKVDYLGSLGGSQLKTIDQVESLQQTNPDIVIWPFAFRNDNAYGMNVQIEPFDDIRVRKAMQMAINLEEISSAYYRGYADTIPQGMLRDGARTNADFGLRFRTEDGSCSCGAVGPDEVQGRWKRTERRRF